MTSIVCFQTVMQIFRKADVKMLRVAFASENVDVEKAHAFNFGLPSRSSWRSKLFARLSCTSARQPLLSLRSSEGWCAVQVSNLRPLPCEGNALPLS